MDDGMTPLQRLRRDIVRPFPVLFSKGRCAAYALVSCVVYGLLYVTLTTIAFSFTKFYLLPPDGLGV
jgi:hypothetical protein